MEFRRKTSSLYSHFVFYPNQKFEKKAVAQCLFVRNSIRKLLTDVGAGFVIGGHLFCCYKQCGFKDDGVQCVQDLSPYLQSGRFPAGRCYILPDPRDSTTTDNHLHILVFLPPEQLQKKDGICKESHLEPGNNSKKFKLELKANPCDEELSSTKLGDSDSIMKYELDNREQQTSSDKQKSGVSGEGCQLSKRGSPFLVRETAVNWELESTVRKIQQFFQTTLRNKEEFGSFHVQQRNVWCPYSIWSSFWGCTNDNFRLLHGNIFEKQMADERNKQSTGYANRELFPKREPKMRAKVTWELHCIWENERR